MADLQVVSAPTQSPLTVTQAPVQPGLSVQKLAPPAISVARPVAQPQINVQPLAPQPQITSIGTATSQQPYTAPKSVAEFAAAVKAKYPEYGNADDLKLTQAMLQKYPQYASQVFIPKTEAPQRQGKSAGYNEDKGPLAALGNFDLGVAKSLGQSATGLLKLGGKVGNFVTGNGFQVNEDPNSLIGHIDQKLASSNKYQQIGNVVGDVAQFFTPAGEEKAAALAAPKVAELLGLGSKAEKAVALGTKALTVGAKDYTIAESQGQSNKASAVIGGLGALGPLVEAGVQSIAKPVASRTMNSLISPLAKEFRFGKNPGLAVAEEGITANTEKGLAENITTKKNEIGKAVADHLKAADVVDPRTINFAPLLKPIDDAMQAAANSGDKALVSRLSDLRDGLTKTYKVVEGQLVETGAKDLTLNRTEANALKQQIGEATKWTGQPFDNQLNQVRVKLYQNVNDAIDAITPGTKAANLRYANLLSAQKSIERMAALGEKKPILGLKDIVALVSGGGAGYFKGGGVGSILGSLTTEALYQLARSTAVKSRFAAQIAKYIPDVAEVIKKASPEVDKAISIELSKRGEVVPTQTIKAADLGQPPINTEKMVRVNNYQEPRFPRYVPQTADTATNTRKIAEAQLQEKYPGFIKGTSLPKAGKNAATRKLLTKLGQTALR